jgi:uncharacterized repeat protein (TIGR03803 family)
VEAQTYTFKVLYSLTEKPGGANPSEGLTLDTNGNLYGTTAVGGTFHNCVPFTYKGTCGTVFKVNTNGVEKILHSFIGPNEDGALPNGDLVRDEKGNLYGATMEGGDWTCDGSGLGCGTVFKVGPTGKEIVLYDFGPNGTFPYAGLRRDKEGNLYGTTVFGGSGNCSGYYGKGCGTVFKVDPTGSETVLYSFTGTGEDGEYPFSRPIGNGTGNVYGTTSEGGVYGYGTVFKLETPTYAETVLYSFTGSNEIGYSTGLILDTEENMYGTTGYGGTYNYGTVFKLDTAGNETVLHSFNGKDGELPTETALVRDEKGNLYGVTLWGGGSTNCSNGCGTVFKVSSTGKETVLHSFNGTDGEYPTGYLLQDANGNFYGVTTNGGAHGFGTVFKLILTRSKRIRQQTADRHQLQIIDDYEVQLSSRLLQAARLRSEFAD